MHYSDAVKQRIFKVLYGRRPDGPHKLPRCPSRDFKIMQEFELEGDFSHSDNNHVCAECQCRKTAGSDTKGNFWGEGPEWEEVGHYGVGYCAEHERVYAKKFHMDVKKFAIQHRDSIMETGRVTKYDPKAVANYQAELSKRNIQLVKNMETLQEKTNEFLEFLDESKKKDDRVIVAAIDNLLDEIRDYDWDNQKTRDKFIREIEDRILIASSLTESSGGRIIPMTDKTKIDCIRNLVKDISKLNLDEYRMGKDAYVKVDEIKVRIPKMLKLTEIMVQKIYEGYMSHDQVNNNFKEILDDLLDEWIEENVKLWDSLN